MTKKEAAPAGESGARNKASGTSRTAGPSGPRSSGEASAPKQQRMKKQDQSRKPMGAHPHEKNQHPLDQTEQGTPRHSSRNLPVATRASDLFREVTDLAPSAKK